MSFIVTKTIKWTVSTSPDVAKHRVFVVKDTDTINYNSPYEDVDMPETSLELPSNFDMSVEGNYKIGLCAIDDTGNMSDIVEITDFFDFNPPLAPTNVEIITS